MKKLTAVEWLWEQLLNLDIEFDSVLIGRTSYLVKRNYILMQANKLFEEQIVEANNRCFRVAKRNIAENAQDYYNETFKEPEL